MGNSTSRKTSEWQKLAIIQLKKNHYLYIIIDKQCSNDDDKYLAYEIIEDRIIPLIISSHTFFEQTGTLMFFTCLGTIKLPGQPNLHPQVDDTTVKFLSTTGMEKEVEDRIFLLALQQGINIPISQVKI